MSKEEKEDRRGPPEFDSGVPPPYSHSADNYLPSYEDLPHKKVDLPPYQDQDGEQYHGADSSSSSFSGNRHVHDLIATSEALGTDSVFILCFLICFLFNWLGYLICFCLFTSVAARCGAISGIGLNLVKLLLILKRCSFENPQMVQAQQYMQLHEIQYMLLMSLGLLVLIFGVLRYNSAKTVVRQTLLLPRYM